MKKLNCFNFAGNNGGLRLGHAPWIGGISGLLIGSLLAVGCSKQNNPQPTSAETQVPTNQAVLNQPVVPAPVAAAEITPSPGAKQIVHKRPSTVTYKNDSYGVSFRYPRIAALKKGDTNDDDSTDFVQPGGVTAVSVELPKGLYPNTDLTSAFFRVNVNPELTEADCAQFALPQVVASDKAAVQPSRMELGTLELQEIEDISGEDAKQTDTKYYHLFQNNSCYEFALGMSTESPGDDETIRPVNREKVFRRLETILATVKIKPQAATQVASTGATALEPTAPPVQDGASK